MSAFLLSVHVLAAIMTIGPVAVAASMFGAAWRAARERPDARRIAVVRVLARITSVYAVIGLLVPVFGVATGASLGVLGEAWLLVSMVLTAAAAAILIGLILPGQRRALAELEGLEQGVPEVGRDPGDEEAGRDPEKIGSDRRLAITTGVFNLLWAIVVVLMICRPGSTTGVGL